MFGTCGANCRVLKARKAIGFHPLHGFQDVVSVVGIFAGTHPLSGTPYPNNSKAVFPLGSGFENAPVYWEPNWSLTANPDAWGDFSETRRWLNRVITQTAPRFDGITFEKTVITEEINKWTGAYTRIESPVEIVSSAGPLGLIETPSEANYPRPYAFGTGRLNIKVSNENSFSEAMDRLIEAVDAVDLEAISWDDINFYQVLKGFDASGNVTTQATNNVAFLPSTGGFGFDQFPVPTMAFTAIGCTQSRTDKGATLVYGKLHVLTTDNICYFRESREGGEYAGGSGGFYTPGTSALAQHYNSTCDGGTCSMPAFSGPASVYRFEPDAEAARDYRRTLDYNGLRIHMNCNGPAACKVIGEQP